MFYTFSHKLIIMHIIEHILENINYLAVFVAALANFFIGAIWYSPLMFAKPWMKEVYNTTDPNDIKHKGNMGITMGIAFVMTFITAFGLAIFIYMMPDSIMIKERLMWSMGTAGVISVFVIAANTYKHYQFEQRTFKLALINAGHDITVFMVMALIMAYWK